MSNIARMMQRATAGAGDAALDITDVFSTYLYDGTGSAQTITNGIDLDGEGGLVWVKSRSSGHSPQIYDTARGATYYMETTSTNGSVAESNGLTSFNSSGFSVGSDYPLNGSGEDFASWTFRKAPKFFDIVTYTGNGTAGRTISHDLGTAVGMLIVKSTSHSTSWKVQHRSTGATNALELNDTRGSNDVSTAFWNDTAASSTHFTVGTDSGVNTSGRTYVAYLFAHNNGDGEFGPDSDQDIIKCGSYTADSSNAYAVDVGFEPQWVMIKRTDSTGDWEMLDAMRGFTADPSGGKFLEANKSGAEFSDSGAYLTSTGFVGSNQSGSNGASYIYTAIRRGPLTPPEDATKVFAIDHVPTTTTPKFRASFAVDMALQKEVDRAESWYSASRLTQGKYLVPQATDAQAASTNFIFDYNNGWSDQGGDNWTSWMWKRAPGYFDAVAFTGTGSARTVSHNLGVAPEMMWIKNRDDDETLVVYHTGTGNDGYMVLSSSGSRIAESNIFQSTTPTESVFSVGADVSLSSKDYIAYLFSTLAGVSKVGSYTGNSSSQTIDCGFTNGARFVLIKSHNDGGDWQVFDTERGIVAGDDGRILLNRTDAEGNDDYIDPHSSGFSLPNHAFTNSNAQGQQYIFYAIA